MQRGYKAITLLIMVSALVTMAGCSVNINLDRNRGGGQEPELVHYHHAGDTTLVYFDDIDYTDIEYEEIVYSAGRLAIGPSEPWYAGVLHLTDKEAERLWAEYDWRECDFPKIELYDVDIDDPSESVWYSSEDFNAVIGSTVEVLDMVFNGREIVFYLKDH